MLSLGDGIAIAGLFFLLIAVIAKWRTPLDSKGTNLTEPKRGYVTEKTCEARTDGMKTQLVDIKASIAELFKKMDSLDLKKLTLQISELNKNLERTRTKY